MSKLILYLYRFKVKRELLLKVLRFFFHFAHISFARISRRLISKKGGSELLNAIPFNLEKKLSIRIE